MNTDLTCTIGYYLDSKLVRMFEAQLPSTEDDLFNGISFELDMLFDTIEDEPHLVAQVADPDGNPIYRCTRGCEDGILQVEDLASSDYYVAYSEESYNFEVDSNIYEILY